MSGGIRSCALRPDPAKPVETDRGPVVAARRRPAQGGQSQHPGKPRSLVRRHHPATGPGIARRPGKPCRHRYRADAAAIGRPRHRRRRRRPAGRRTARLRRRMAADGERHGQSAAHPRQYRASWRNSSPPNASTSSTRRAPGAAWSAIPATDRMPVFLVTSFPDRLPATVLAGHAVRPLAGARRPRDRTVELRVAGDDRALPASRPSASPSSRARSTPRRSARRRSTPSASPPAPRLGRPAAHARRAGARAASRRGTGR